MNSDLKHGLVLVIKGANQTDVGYYADDVDGAMENEVAALVTFERNGKFVQEMVQPSLLVNLESHVAGNSLFASLIKHEEHQDSLRVFAKKV